MYADDTSLLYLSKNIYELIVRLYIELTKINRWFVVNKLIIIESYTIFIVFHRSNKLVTTVLPHFGLRLYLSIEYIRSCS